METDMKNIYQIGKQVYCLDGDELLTRIVTGIFLRDKTLIYILKQSVGNSGGLEKGEQEIFNNPRIILNKQIKKLEDRIKNRQWEIEKFNKHFGNKSKTDECETIQSQ